MKAKLLRLSVSSKRLHHPLVFVFALQFRSAGRVLRRVGLGLSNIWSGFEKQHCSRGTRWPALILHCWRSRRRNQYQNQKVLIVIVQSATKLKSAMLAVPFVHQKNIPGQTEPHHQQNNKVSGNTCDPPTRVHQTHQGRDSTQLLWILGGKPSDKDGQYYSG